MTDDVTITVGNTAISGWQSVSITRSVETMPASCVLQVTEHFTDDDTAVSVLPGAPCVIKIGPDVVITGYVDRYGLAVGPSEHGIRIIGRSKSCDLVDCSALVPGMQLYKKTLGGLARELVKPFAGNIGVQLPAGSDSAPLPVLAVNLGETPYQILEVVARTQGFALYDAPNGDIVFSRVGSSTMASGFQQGVNAQVANVEFSMDGRYSEYIPQRTSYEMYADIGPDGNSVGPKVLDQGVPRYRPLVIISEQFVNSQSLAQLRAQWECNRRRGRSQSVTVVCDSWRDSAGTLWTPNALAQVDLPILKLSGVQWLIVDVTYSRDARRGTTARVTLMPPEALSIEPTPTNLYDPQVHEALNGGTGDGRRDRN